MERRILGKTGLEVAVLGFGGAPVGLLATEQSEVADILNLLLDRGVNLIDTAAGYAGSEAAIGNAVAHRRDEYVLVSKCGRADDEIPGEAWSPSLIAATVDRALRRLRTDHLDVMLLHSCDLEVLKRGEALGALVKARDAGKVRFVGYSGDNETAAFAAELPDVAVLETSVNICDQANLERVLPKARQHDVGTIVKRPIANAAWKDLSEQLGFYTDYAKTYTQRLAEMRITPADLGFEGAPRDVWPEIALRFTLSWPDVHTAIIGSTNQKHVEANLAAAEKGPLPRETLQQLQDAFRRAEAKSGKPWLGET